ncbi:FTR1 family protein [Dyella jiangningensis]|uniref:FTR1 family protein n=1 Tax=Dyella jiangningensis TaxID=1379159 RepID=UPI000A779489|nr:FTR1 family protein [Dyella jiangningensis]MDG2538934.1 FTR1 family protein [Dyella jiangningensis]
MTRIRAPFAAFLLGLATVLSPVHATDTSPPDVSQTWQMLDYLAVDYAGAVHQGQVLSTSEYEEMREFARRARDKVDALPATPASAALHAQADQLVALIDGKATEADVARQAHGLANGLLQAYPVPTSPTRAPDLSRGATLYQAQCATCHGATGHGDGPAGLQLTPRPIDFTDQARADQRSALSLYEVITQGVADTPMVSYKTTLSDDDRWALAYYVGTLAYADASQRGAQAWQQDARARGAIASPSELARARVSELAEAVGVDQARLIVGYLRAHPEALHQALEGVPLARARLSASLDAYRRGSTDEAQQFALSAYLDGIEPIEARLDARDSALRTRIETAMGAYRTSLSRSGNQDAVAARAHAIDGMLEQAHQLLTAAAASPAATFVGALTILVREGLEALLVVVALLAFLRKADRHDATRYVHAGWTLALLAGAITWGIASYAISISGASRELTEGLSSLFAAAVLLGVGLWMHQKSIGGRWQSYLKAKMATALDRKSAWFVFGLTFVSVYREVFETILFYTALWNEGQGLWLLAGLATGAVLLAVIAWLLLRSSRRLPLGTFFSVSSAVIAVLAVVLTGKGVAALQEAGWTAVTTAPAPSIDWLGIYPTWQSLLAQLAVTLMLIGGFALNRWRARAA